MTLEESQRVLDRIDNDELDFKAADIYSAITDNTDVLLRAKPFLTTNGTTRRSKAQQQTSTVGFRSELRSTNAHRTPGISVPGASDAHKLNTADKGPVKVPLSSSGNLTESRRLFSSWPRMEARSDVIRRNKTLPEDDRHVRYSIVESDGQAKTKLESKLQSVQGRNRVLRQLLRSHDYVGRRRVLSPVELENLSLLEAVRLERSGPVNTDVFSSTFKNSPKKLTIDVSSIESAGSSEVQRSGRKHRAKVSTDETAAKLLADVTNEKHKEYLNSLIKDIEESSSSVVTSPWLETLQAELGMRVGESSARTKEEREALSLEAEQIIRSTKQRSKPGSLCVLLFCSSKRFLLAAI